MKLILTFTLLIMIALPSLSYSQEGSKRSRNINFEDEVVEGINRKPLDSFNQISENNGRGKNHLYKKRAGFSDRDEVMLVETRLTQ